MGLQLAAISKRFRMMAERAAKSAAGKSAEGTVQVGMNFRKMMENLKFAAAENAGVFGDPQPKIFVLALLAQVSKNCSFLTSFIVK